MLRVFVDGRGDTGVENILTNGVDCSRAIQRPDIRVYLAIPADVRACGPSYDGLSVAEFDGITLSGQ